VRTAEEDTSTTYVLGFYPEEGALDGKYHDLTVKLHGKAPDKQPLEVHYRPGYLATKIALPPPPPTLEELLNGPVNSGGIGLAAQVTPEPEHPDLYDVHITVDLHDIHLDRKGDGHYAGAFDLSVPNPPAEHTIRTGTVALNFTDDQLAKNLETGFKVAVFGAGPESGEIRVVVRDRATGAAGSLRVPVTAR
jgi:hypothetical protein